MGYVFGMYFLLYDGVYCWFGVMEIKIVKDMFDDLYFGKIEIVLCVQDLWGVGILMLCQDFLNYWFDEEYCKDGIEYFDNYCKVYFECMGVFMDGVMSNGYQYVVDVLWQKVQYVVEVDCICKIGVLLSSMKCWWYVGVMVVQSFVIFKGESFMFFCF